VVFAITSYRSLAFTCHRYPVSSGFDYDHRLVTEILNVEVTDCNSKLQLSDTDIFCVQTWCSNEVTYVDFLQTAAHE